MNAIKYIINAIKEFFLETEKEVNNEDLITINKTLREVKNNPRKVIKKFLDNNFNMTDNIKIKLDKKEINEGIELKLPKIGNLINKVIYPNLKKILNKKIQCDQSDQDKDIYSDKENKLLKDLQKFSDIIRDTEENDYLSEIIKEYSDQ